VFYSDLISPRANAMGVGADAATILVAGGLVYVTERGNASDAPEGWVNVGLDGHSYDVHTNSVGRVLAIRRIIDRGALVDANWVIDFVVAPIAMSLAKAGVAICLNAFESLTELAAGRTLTGATAEMATAEAAASQAVKARVAGAYRANVIDASGNTHLNGLEGFAKTLEVPAGNMKAIHRDLVGGGADEVGVTGVTGRTGGTGATGGSGRVFRVGQVDRYTSALRARRAGFANDVMGEIRAFQAKNGYSPPIAEFNAIYDRAVAKWGDLALYIDQ
jgi:hypothetical protein